MRKIILFLVLLTHWIPLISLASTPEVRNAPPQRESCIRPSLVSRTGKENCWARFRKDLSHSICIPHHLWTQWLSSAQALEICPSRDSGWKVWSPPNVSPTHSLRKRIFSTLRIESLSHLKKFPVSKDKPKPLMAAIVKIWKWIEVIREKIGAILKPGDPLGILRSLILNEGTNREPLPMLRKLGFVHLLSATGIHLYALSVWCDRGIQFLTQFLKIPTHIGLRLSRLVSFLVCSTIWILNGCRIGMLRPWGLIILREISNFLGFRWRKASPLILALVIEKLFLNASDPEDLIPTGRWIYALAVGGGLFWHPCFRSTHLGLAIGSWVLVAVYESWHTGTLSIFTPVLSLLTLPVVCLMIYPMLIFSLGWYFLASWLSVVSADSWIILWIQILSQQFTKFILLLTEFAIMPGNFWVVPRWSIISAAILSVFLLFYLVQKPKRQNFNLFCLLVFLVILKFTITQFSKGNETTSRFPFADQIELLDVGQGDASLVLSISTGLSASVGLPASAGIIDTGSKFALTDVQWIEILASRRIKKLDWVAITHLDEDHSGGLTRLARLIPIQCVAIPEPLMNTTRGKKYTSELIRKGIRIRGWNSGCIPYPTFSTGSAFTAEDRNGVMGAVWIPLSLGGFYLSAGDASSEDEVQIAKWVKNLVDLNPCRKTRHSKMENNCQKILKVSHHGSKTSTSVELLKVLQPTEAWISVGIGNHYGHPSPEVLKTLQERLGPSNRIRVRRTDLAGSLNTQISSK